MDDILKLLNERMIKNMQDEIWKKWMDRIWSQMTDEEKRVEIEYAQKLFSSIPNAVDFLLEHAKGPDWDVVQRAMKTLEENFYKKAEDKYQKYFGNNPDTTN